jgi:hypothetical protein
MHYGPIDLPVIKIESRNNYNITKLVAMTLNTKFPIL